MLNYTYLLVNKWIIIFLLFITKISYKTKFKNKLIKKKIFLTCAYVKNIL